MIHHTLRNIYSLFVPGKKSILFSDQPENKNTKPELPADRRHTRLLYHRDINNLKAGDAENNLQYDWWIN